MTPRPRISVCIANYNGLGLIDDCIRSVQSQTELAEAIEIIVHDDASTDSSTAYIRDQYPDVRLIESKENVGFCVANNRMASMARGEYLLLLNNDAALFPDALATLLQAAENLARPAILGLPQYDFDTGKLLDIGSLLDPFLNPVPNHDLKRNDVGMVMGACLWIDKSLWEQLGGFPEWFESIGEDLYLCCRARLTGHPVRALGISGYRHRVGRSFGGGKTRQGRLATTFRRRRLSERNKTFVMALVYPAPFLQILLPLHLLLLLLEGSLLSILNRRLAYLTEIYFPVFTSLYRQRQLLKAERYAIMKTLCIARSDFFSSFVPLPYKLQMLLQHGLPKLT
jgi:GT2 family glycosyltransferase